MKIKKPCKPLYIKDFQGFLRGRGFKDLKLRCNPSCGARNCFAAWSAAQFRPLRQPLLPLSAIGGGRKRCPARSACLGLKSFYTNENEKEPRRDSFSFWQGQKDLTVCCGFALHPFRSATEILTNFSTRLTLLAKNVPPAHFLNAKTLTGSSPLLLYEK